MAKYRVVFDDGSVEVVDVFGPFTARVVGRFMARAKGTRLLNVEEVQGSHGHPLRVRYVEVDGELDRMLEEKKKEWRARGYSGRLISMAEELANEWAWAISEAFAPPEIRATVLKHVYPKALNIADRWITRMGEAAKEGS